MKFFKRPKLSVIMVVYDMGREAPRTLQSLCAAYQKGIDEDDYEVVVVDNGSPVPLGADLVRKYGRNFRYHYVQNASPSPAQAVNMGAQLSRGRIISVMIDGARMVTPGLLHYTLQAFKAWRDPTVVALGWHLGPELQQKSVSKGYNKDVEDGLLKNIDWPQNGYALYDISSLGGSAQDGCFSEIAESNTIGLSRRTFETLGGCDPAFNIPGGGLVNLDLYRRAAERPDTEVVCLLGEGSFHQIHGGASTGSKQEEGKFKAWAAQYQQIRGIPWKVPRRPTVYFGSVSDEVLPHLIWSAENRLALKSRSAKARTD